MNSKYIIIIILFQISILGYSQNLSTTVRQDFCENAKINYYYGTDSFRNWIVISAQKIGLKTPLEIDEALQNICDNIELQEEFFKCIDRLGGSRQFKELQYIKIGMKPKNAKFLNDYMILKYNDNKNENQVYQPKHTDDFVKDTIVIDKKELLKSIYPKSNFLNDSLILRKETVLKIQGGYEEIEFKSIVLKEYSFINEIEDKERINIIIFSRNDKGFGYFDLLKMISLNDKSYNSVGRSKRVNIEGKKLKNIIFKTIKDNGKTYFTMCYEDENNKRFIDYYDINLNFIKTI